MKNINFKSILPHMVAIAVFLLVAVIFCKPALEPDVVMQQSDYTAADGMKQQSVIYKEKHGQYPLWITSMFSGMPAFNIIFDGPVTPIGYIDKIFQFGLPKPLNFFFLSCICFYIFCMCLKIRPYVAILGSIAFAYSTYNPIIAVAGHDTKLLALAYAPAVLGAVILLLEKKYVSGFILTALFTTLHLQQNHQQISFYLFIIIGVLALSYLIKYIREKDWGATLKAFPLMIAGAGLAIMINAITIFPVLDFAKYSKRGGQLVMDNRIDSKTNAIKNDKTVGLTKEYAFDWSYGRTESLSLLFPGITGYGTHYAQRDGDYSIFPKLSENSHVVTYLTNELKIPEDQANNFAANLSGKIYWGDKPFTSGSVYLGASICFLFILGLFLLNNKHKWWLLSATIVGIVLAMGKNLPAINYFLFDHFPVFNKLRTPEMALVIPQITFPIMAVFVVEALIDRDYVDGWKKFKYSVYTIAAIFAIAGILYTSMDYSKENKERTIAVNAAFATPDNTLNAKLQDINNKYKGLVDNQVYEDFLYQTKGDVRISKGLLTALHADRKGFLGSDILRSLLFVLLTVGLVALFMQKKINATVLLIGLPLLTLFDLIPFDMNYINEKSFANKEQHHEDDFPLSDADKKILQDKDPNYRILNLAGGDPFQDSKTSYYHNSIGGYHPAKLGIYDDLITYELSGQPNPSVINMLNTKYFIQRGQQNNTEVAVINPGALGNSWFVKGIKFVSGPAEEMKALDNFNPADTAIIDNEYKSIAVGINAPDSVSSIKQVAVDNEDIKYESSSNTTNLAVFSEIFYKDWKAYIDGKETPVIKANYVLRALVVPAGKHVIEFKFEPKVFKVSYTISLVTGWVLTLLLLWFIYYAYKKSGKNE